MSLIELNNVTLGYEKHIVLRNININIEEGDFICVVGPNGSGKSTLIKGILGLIKPIKGKIKYNGLKQNFIGYMPQETKVDSNFPASVWEIVLSGTLNTLGLKPFYTKEAKQLALDNLKLLHIENLKNKSFSDLSGGQRQKVLLARSLCATSRLLILDEPSNNLDSKSKENLYKTIVELNKEGITIIMITHDLDHGNLIGNKILSLREDDIYYGSTKEFMRRIHHDK